MLHTQRRVNALKVLGYFAAEKTARYRMVGVAINADGTSIQNGDYDRAGIGTIVRAGSVDNRHAEL